MRVIEERRPGDTIALFFSGYSKEDKEECVFEWRKTAEELGISYVLAMDDRAEWYLGCLDEAVVKLRPIVESGKAITIGVSMGGFGALLLGHFLGCPSLTFVPQTNIKTDFMKRIKDDRWHDRLEEINKNHPKYADLSFIEGPQHHIYYSKRMPQDAAHAEQMRVSLHPEDHNEHNLARHLKKQGRFKEIIEFHVRGLT